MALARLARNQARYYAAQNKVYGTRLDLQLPLSDTANPADADVVRAYLDKPRSSDPQERVLIVRDLDGSYDGAPFLPLVNTVRINARRLKSRGTAIPLFGGLFTGHVSADA